jgi:hypothetical protein
MRGTATLVAVAMACLLYPGSEAHARSSAATHSVPLGRIVTIEIIEGGRISGRVVQITAVGVDLKKMDGTTLTVPWEQILRVTLGPLPGTRSPRNARLTAKKPPTSRLGPAWQPRDFYVEYIGLRIAAGGIANPNEFYMEPAMGGFDVTLFTLHWRHFYWEVFRGVFTFPFLGVGGAIGIPIRLDSAGRHELRVGAHLTVNLTSLWEESSNDSFLGTSGVQIYYQYRMAKYFAFHIGFQQYSYPFALALIFGFSM